MLGAVPLSDFVPKLMCSVQLRTSVKTRIWARIFSSVGSRLWDASKTLSGIVKKGCDQFQRLQLRCSSPLCVSAVREARLPCYFTITLSLVSAKSHQPPIDQVSRFRGKPDIASLADLLLVHFAFLKWTYFYFLPAA